MRKYLFLIGLFVFVCLLIPLVAADDITFSIEQKEYYFLTGQQAIIPLTTNNTYGKDIEGMMKYTITQEINQGGYMYSSTNSQSQSYSVPIGNQTIRVNFGSSDKPLTLRVSLVFSYSEGNEQREVSLDDISIYFVSNQSQMNNQKNPQQSSSEQITHAEPSKNSQQQPQTPLEKLQNNQKSQDSAALKEQIQQQLEAQQEQQEAFEQTLFNNSEFQRYHQDMLNQGYTLSEKQLHAESNNTGSFNLTYKNQQGETANLQGKMEDGKLQNVEKQTAEDRKEMLEALNQSEQFQQYDTMLQQEGFNQTSVSFDQQGNKTTVQMTYTNKDNQTAMITAEFKDKQLKDVRLSKQEEMNVFFWIIPIIMGSLFVAFYFYYRYQKKKRILESDGTKHSVEKPFDYKSEAKRLLLEAEELYRQKKYKDAYGKAGQALRLYLSYEYGLRKELTNEEIIRFLKTKKQPYSEIKRCFDLCSLVEFAKYTADEKEFHTIRSTVGNIIAG